MNDRRSDDLIEKALFSDSVFKKGGEVTLNQAYVPDNRMKHFGISLQAKSSQLLPF